MKGAIILALMLILVGVAGMLGTHTEPSLSVFSTPLQDSPSTTFKFYDYRGIQEGAVNVSIDRPSGLFAYGSDPIIISTWLMNGESSQFGDMGLISGYSNNTNVFGSVVWSVLFRNISSSTWNTLYGDAYYENITELGQGLTGSSIKFTSGLDFPTFGIYRQLSGTIKLQAQVYVNTTAAWDQGIYHKTATLYREFYVVPGGGTISASPAVQQIGGNVYIHGQVDFGQYYVMLYGSQGYNGGQLIKNFTISGQNTVYNFTYRVPSDAFVSSSNPEENMFTVELWNSLLAQKVDNFFSVDSLNLIPPEPMVKITNTPTNDKWIVGQQVDVFVHAPSNNNSSSSITSVIVWVYYDFGGEPASGSSYWIIYQQNVPVIKGNATFSFQIGNLIGSITIKVVSVDSQSRASPPSQNTIQASQISTSGAVSSATLIALIISVLSAAVGVVAVWFAYPGSAPSKAIVIMGVIGMMAMLYFPIAFYMATVI